MRRTSYHPRRGEYVIRRLRYRRWQVPPIFRVEEIGPRGWTRIKPAFASGPEAFAHETILAPHPDDCPLVYDELTLDFGRPCACWRCVARSIFRRLHDEWLAERAACS